MSPQPKRPHVPKPEPANAASFKPFRIHVGGKVILPLRDASTNAPQVVTIMDTGGEPDYYTVVDAGPGWAVIKRMS